MSEQRDSEIRNSEKRVPETPATTEAGIGSATPAVPSGGATSGDTAREIGGRGGPDPVRYGDWEKNGRCIDF